MKVPTTFQRWWDAWSTSNSGVCRTLVALGALGTVHATAKEAFLAGKKAERRKPLRRRL